MLCSGMNTMSTGPFCSYIPKDFTFGRPEAEDDRVYESRASRRSFEHHIFHGRQESYLEYGEPDDCSTVGDKPSEGYGSSAKPLGRLSWYTTCTEVRVLVLELVFYMLIF